MSIDHMSWLTMAVTLPGRLLSTEVYSAASIIVPCGMVWPGCVILGAGGVFRARACAQKIRRIFAGRQGFPC